MVVRNGKSNSRTHKEEVERRVYDMFASSFYDFYENKLHHFEHDVLFAYNKNVSKRKVWAYFDFNKKYGSLIVYLNFDLTENKKDLVILTAQRMALKIGLYKSGQEFSETSPDYAVLAKHYYLWNYMGFPETPQNWHVYKCSICGNRMAVFPSRLPNNNELTSTMKTPWHNKKMVDSDEGGKVHQGNYAYSGFEELTNSELQKILFIMKSSVQFTDNFQDNQLHFEEDDYDNSNYN